MTDNLIERVRELIYDAHHGIPAAAVVALCREAIAADIEGLHCPGAPRTGDEIYNEAIATAARLVRRGEQQ